MVIEARPTTEYLLEFEIKSVSDWGFVLIGTTLPYLYGFKNPLVYDVHLLILESFILFLSTLQSVSRKYSISNML